MENPTSIREILQDIRILLQQIEQHQRQGLRPLRALRDCSACLYPPAPPAAAAGEASRPGRGRPEVLTPTVLPSGQWLDRQAVMDYLRISYSTYYRLKSSGTLNPRRFGRRDYYFLPDLEEARNESIRKGRV